MSTSTSRFGCLGCSWLGAMVLGTVVLSGALILLAPQWLEPLLFWREPIPEPEVILIPAELVEMEPEPIPDPETEVERWEEFAETGRYTEEDGLELEIIGGSKWRFPPGSISGNRDVVVTPVVWAPPAMTQHNGNPVGQVFHLEIDGEEHWTFDRPVEIEIPFDPELSVESADQSKPGMAVWEGDHWQPLPIGHDSARGVLTARTSHASVLCVFGKIGAVGGILYGIANPEGVLAAIQQLKKGTDAVYSTKNFDLNYISAGKKGAPMADAEYLKRTTYRGKKHAGHPLYVTDLGDFLEETRAWLPDIKMKVPEVWFDKWEVFVVPIPDFGASYIGGPLTISTTMKHKDENDNEIWPKDLYYDMRRTCLHELIHVAQDEWLTIPQMFTHRWWIETTAEHLSVELMKTRGGQPNPKPYFYTSKKRGLHLPTVGLDGAEAIQPYAYARLFDSMKDKGVNTVEVIKAVNERWFITEKALDEEIQSRSKGPGLFDFHAAFARDYYYDNAWTGNMTGLDKANAVYATGNDMFLRITTHSRVKRFVVKFYDERRIAEPPVVSKIYPFSAAALPEERETRLVVQVEAPHGATDVSVFFSEQRGNPPFSGKTTPIATHYPSPVTTIMSSNRMAGSLKKATDISRVVVTVNHGSFATGDAPIIVRRWLLMAPAWVRPYRQTDGTYEVTWHPAEIKSSGDGYAFKGYHVYRRKVGATEFPEKPINLVPMTDEFFIDTPPSQGFWEYTVRVEDSAGNIGEPAPVDTGPDPFIGVWKGKLKLIDGSISELATRLARSEIGKMGAGNEAGVEGMISMIRGMTMGIDALLQFGIPVTCEVQPHRRKYKLTIVSVLGKPVDDEDELVLDRLGHSTIGMLPKTPRGNALLLSVNKPDRVHHKYFDTIENDPDIGTMRFGLEIDFERQNTKKGR